MNNLTVSSSPHIHSPKTTQGIMLDVIIAMIPAAVMSVILFGFRALVVELFCMAGCLGLEALWNWSFNADQTIGDLSALVTGLMLAFNMPVSIPLWQAFIGCIVAIIVVKMLFGGIGQNFMNPALGARCFLLICFTARMTTFTYDGVTCATPLANLKNGEAVNTWNMVIGKIPGTIGETSVVAIIIGAIILILFDVIDMKIPAAYFITFVIFIGLFGGHGWNAYYITAQLAGGGLMLGAFFMATDYATSPITPLGKIIYGIILGLLTGFGAGF